MKNVEEDELVNILNDFIENVINHKTFGYKKIKFSICIIRLLTGSQYTFIENFLKQKQNIFFYIEILRKFFILLYIFII